MKIEKAVELFDSVFGDPMQGAAVDLREYARALLLGKPCDLSGLTQQQRSGLESWHARCGVVVSRAERFAREGVARASLEFDSLKKEARKLALEYFQGSDLGLVTGRMFQAYDSVSQGYVATTAEKGEPVVASGEVWRPYPFLPVPALALLREIQKFACWGKRGEKDLERCVREFKEQFSADDGLVAVAQENGRLVSRLNDRAYQLGLLPGGEKQIEGLLSAAELPKYEAGIVRKSFEAGRVAKKRSTEASRLVCKAKKIAQKASHEVAHAPSPAGAGKAVSLPQGAGPRTVALEETALHPNSILGLRPARKWTIVADETGTQFNLSEKSTGDKTGRSAFVLIPEGTTLPKLEPGWHAVDCGATELVEVAENLHRSGCGILGVSVEDLYRTNRRLWHSCVELLLDIVLRLLPVDGNTEINLEVEQCGGVDAQMEALLEKTVDDVMYHLSLVHPEKAANIKLSARYVKKTDSPWNGYADLVAYSWGCGKQMREVFRPFGWVGPCLIAEDPQTAKTFHRCLDILRQDGTLSAADWSALATCREATAIGSLIGALLRAYGEEARDDLKKWRTYLDYTLAHLDSKAIQMDVLKPQIAWLKEYEPAEASLPPRLRLLWLTAQLAAENHAGGVSFGSSEHAAEFRELCEKLKDEDASLTCFAALHLAVEKTDSFEFDAARALVEPWENEPIAVPGLRYHAQVLSSLGQHAAFLGDNARALDYFTRAKTAFTRLSDEWQEDYKQTNAYAVIAAMDDASPALDSLLVEYLYGGTPNQETMVDKAQQFAGVGGGEPDSKYAHAIFVRYLVTLPADHPVRQAYLACKDKWQWCEDGHPWELIAFYRAVLLGNSPEACDWLRRGIALCQQAGPTLKVIGCVLLGTLLDWRCTDREAYVAKAEEAVALLPALGDERVAALREQAERPRAGLDLARAVLPFNFR